jgi:hypothetical protein
LNFFSKHCKRLPSDPNARVNSTSMSFLDERFVAAIVRLTEKTQKLRSSDHELPAGRSEPAPAVTGNFSIRTQQQVFAAVFFTRFLVHLTVLSSPQADANATSSTTQVSTMSTLSRGAGGVAPSTGGDVESDSDHDDEDDFHSSQMLVSGFRGALLVRNDTNNEGAVDENGRRRKAFRSLNETDRVKAELSVFGTMLDQQKPQQARELPRVLAEEGYTDIVFDSSSASCFSRFVVISVFMTPIGPKYPIPIGSCWRRV